MISKFYLYSTLVLSLAFQSLAYSAQAEGNPLIPRTERLKALRVAENRLQQVEDSTYRDIKTKNNILVGALVELAFQRANSGDTVGAIAAFDRMPHEKKSVPTSDLTKINTSIAEDAFTAIMRQAQDKQIVILNEAHHVPMHRAFAMLLARRLRQIGFEYLACETLNGVDLNPLSKKYVNENAGVFSSEPMYANFIRDAIQAKWKFVSYEPSERQRESGMAKNLVERIFKNNPKAKVFIFVGYGHLSELPEAFADNDKSMMAAQIKRLTGIDPLTIDQTQMYQHYYSESQSALYQASLKKKTEEKPFVLKSPENEYLKFEMIPASVDLQVFHTPYRIDSKTGRESWLSSMAGFTPHDIPKEFLPIKARRLVYAYHLNDPIDSVPADVVLLEVGKPVPKLMLPKGEFRFAFED